MQEELDVTLWNEIEQIKSSISLEGLEDINSILDDYFEQDESFDHGDKA